MVFLQEITMNKLRKLAIFGALVVTLAALPATSYASYSSPPSVPAMSHTLCDYVSDGTRPLLMWGSRDNPSKSYYPVRQAQGLINIYSFAPGTLAEDGIFGQYTYNAVVWVQRCAKNNGLPNTIVDGKIGSQTWSILYNQPARCGTRPIGNPH
jgi:hypothetical protein